MRGFAVKRFPKWETEQMPNEERWPSWSANFEKAAFWGSNGYFIH
jgi:hypothetical protein